MAGWRLQRDERKAATRAAARYAAVLLVGAWIVGPTPGAVAAPWRTHPPAVQGDAVGVALAGARVTQGLQSQVLLAGRHTLAQARVGGGGAWGTVKSAICVVTPETGAQRPFIVPAEWPDMAVPQLTRGSGERVFNCWVTPDPLLRGSYRFELRLTINDQSYRFALGSAEFRSSRDLRLLVLPWQAPPHTGKPPPDDRDPEHRIYDAEVEKALLKAMRDLGRIWPLRAGVGAFDAVGRNPTEGLRFLSLRRGSALTMPSTGGSMAICHGATRMPAAWRMRCWNDGTTTWLSWRATTGAGGIVLTRRSRYL